MFTGIIEEVGTIGAVHELGGGRRFLLQANMAPELRPDQSVSTNGVCLTVVAIQGNTFTVEAVEETLQKTTLGAFKTGQKVNLERAMRPDGRLDGHLVQGHVDSTGVITAIDTLPTSWLYTVRFDPAFAPFLIPVGSITLDGVSLTVARLDSITLTVSIIPHTYEKTIISDWRVGQQVNMEFDLIGKYVARQLAHHKADDSSPNQITKSWLRDQGY